MILFCSAPPHRPGPAPDDLLTHVSPLGWRLISLTGDYLWQEVSSGIGDKRFRALNIPGEVKIRIA
jgi:hypothetical protein